ncbi:mau2 chromatid cohesion factor [Geranomyces variabilis]|uniref:Mau2 chromatid cohesion factor n=1 Tax=Geranomyces variabilis TaxID=109894 RepID=A0AAD5TSC9_9FUNG|nr:mau2 chromatid cohesion factor [Geranomyces variabilis]
MQVEHKEVSSSASLAQQRCPPVPEPAAPLPLLPYQLIWALAEHHVAAARSSNASATADLSASPQQQRPAASFLAQPPSPTAQRHLRDAFRCLEAVLVANVLPPHCEVKTRYRLASLLFVHAAPENLLHAEAHLNKASLLLLRQSDPEMREYFFAVRDLQARVTTAADADAAQTAAEDEKEAHRLEMWKWYYHFAMRRGELLARDGQVKACCSVLTQAAAEATKVGHLDMKGALLLALTHHLIKAQSFGLATDQLTQLGVLFDPASKRHEHLRLYYTLTFILHSLHLGNTKDALECLDSLHQQVETPAPIVQAEMETGIANISLPRSDRDSADDDFAVSLLSRNQLYALVFLVSGMVHKSNDTFKAKKHFIEGLKTIEQSVNLPTLTPSNWAPEIKIILFRHLAEVSMIRAELNDAYRIMTKIMEWCAADSHLWQKHWMMVAYDWAMLYQAAGRFDKAASWLRNIIATGGADLRFLAKAHLIVMAFGGATPDMGEAVAMLAQLRDSNGTSRDQPAYSAAQLCILELLNGMEHMVRGNIRDTKCHLLACVKMNEQLVCVQLRCASVGLLGDLFLQLEPRQAEKMFNTTYAMAKKQHCDAVAAASAAALSDIDRAARDAAGKEDKHGISATAHQVAVDGARAELCARLAEWELTESPGMFWPAY